MNKSPVSILYGVNGGGYAEVSARAGTAVPANHPSLPILGSDGTSFRHLFTDSSGRLFISAASLPLPTGAATEATLATLLTTAAFQARINTLGQKTAANSTPVVLASDQTVIPVSDNGGSLTVDGTVAATQSGAWTVASTQSGAWTVAATQSGIWTVGQSGSPWGVNLTQIGGVAINAGNGLAGTGSQRVTIASDNTPFTVNAAQSGLWNVGQSGTWTVQPGNTPNTIPWLTRPSDDTNHVTITAPSAPVLASDPAMAVSLSPNSPLPSGANIIGSLVANQSVNLAQVGGIIVDKGNGVANGGTQRVAIASDNTPFTVNAAQSGTWTVQQGTAPWTNRIQDGVGSNLLAINGSGQVAIQNQPNMDVALSTRASEATLATLLTTAAFQARINTLGQKTMANSTPVVLASDQTVIPVSQSGTWTVQPGNTQNTTPWLMRPSDGTNNVNVKAASTAAVAADPSLVVALSPNSPLPTGTNIVGALVANQTVNLAQVGGTNTVSGGVAGSQGVGGLAANAAAVTGNPVLVAGSDGTNARTIKSDATGHQYTRPIQPITFTVFTSSVTPGNGKSMVSIHNNSAFIVKIWKIAMVNTQTSSVAGVTTDFQTRRFTSHSGGTSITPSTNDSADTVDAGITAATGATLVGESSTAGRRALYSSDEWTGGGAAASTESLQQIGQQLHPWLNYGDMPWIKPPTLRPGEGLNVKCVTNTTVGSWDFHIICTQEPA